MKHYDALVVGGGPAGSTTAYRLADAGAGVCEAVGGGRPGGAGADDRDVERGHDPKATMARLPGGCARAAKGNGL